MLFMAIFLIALSGTGRGIGTVPFKAFLAPGLIMMALLQNSFANTTSSLMGAKVQGNIVDVLMPPLSAGELVMAYAAGGVTRGHRGPSVHRVRMDDLEIANVRGYGGLQRT